jgi:SRSO17 transposase
VRHRENWRLALDMIDEITGGEDAGGWGLPTRPVVTDAGYGEITAFRLGLQARGLPYVAAVSGTTSAYPASAAPQSLPYAGRGRPPVPRYRGQPSSLRALVTEAGRKACRYVTWRHGSKRAPANRMAAMRSRFTALRVRPADRDIPREPDGSLPECWLIAEWPPGQPEPTDYWLSDLPAQHQPARPGTPGQDPLARRARPPRAQGRPGPGPLRRPQLHRLAPPRHPHRLGPGILHPAAV